ncbi:non-hydrolyzing UDP-N-acetylglucosamine 2-epimerase [Dethiosulfovibrio salsuginis]|uniref:UDP-N-acetylglucosamine 2-epimerase (non-hydrolyzing) n=1 Tax=Dethiosulfovibrio salsuginis TaxID=561720 RepID=A0A1X7JYA2_9BACT|nr:UDP-N-acetylglucosamine 2-epimerase (non-hydrolyzing) [Dethiosulfovibrio salsuginis]SMG33529.1 UDP-N-Acetylglucosamine 2-epimerase [Dethiosulfovibrio salsuginis]
MNVVLAFGTRPEAIKMAPVYLALKETSLNPKILLTGQHREQLYQAMDLFSISAEANLDVMTDRQTLPDLAAKILPQAAKALRELNADYVLVHGDTLTTFVVAWAAFLEGIPIGHVEAGLRSGSMAEPFPEEANRVLTDVIADLYFPPTDESRDNLLLEGKDINRIIVTGQTGVDAILHAATKGTMPVEVPQGHKLVTVTLHRRENWPVLAKLAKAVAEIARQHRDHLFVYPVHLNPVVREAVYPALEGEPNVKLIEPLDYGSMAALLCASELILTDSGGLQEEGASLAVPVAVARNVTERPEGVKAGIITLVGNDPEPFKKKVLALLNDEKRLSQMASSPNPYGDGKASVRVAKALEERLYR